MVVPWLSAAGPVGMTVLDYDNEKLLVTKYFNWLMPASPDYRVSLYNDPSGAPMALLTRKGEVPVQASIMAKVLALNDSKTVATLYLIAQAGSAYYSIRAVVSARGGVFFTARLMDPNVARKFISFLSSAQPQPATAPEPQPQLSAPAQEIPEEAKAIIKKSKVLMKAWTLAREGYGPDQIFNELISAGYKPSTISKHARKIAQLVEIANK